MLFPKCGLPPFLRVIGVFLLVATALTGCVSRGEVAVSPSTLPENPPAQSPKDTQPSKKKSPITGEMVDDVGPIVAVSIDNHPDARPQSGLEDADLVYEVPVEGGITRYLAIFCSRAPKTAGPVRSVREYMVALAKEWGALLAHCGGDPKGLKAIRDWGVPDADDLKGTGYFWRDRSRAAPHNLYTDVTRLQALAPAGKELKPRFEFHLPTGTPAKALKVSFNRNYSVEFLLQDGKYSRVIEDKSAPAESSQASLDGISNIIVQFAESSVVDSEGRLDLAITGKGKASFLLGGEYCQGTWEKPDLDSPTCFYRNGEKIRLSPGKTWILIVPTSAQVSVSIGD